MLILKVPENILISSWGKINKSSVVSLLKRNENHTENSCHSPIKPQGVTITP